MRGTKIAPKTIVPDVGEPESRFNRVIKQYDGVINKLLNDNKVYRIIALLSIVIVVFATIGWFKALSMKNESLLIVEVNELGKARYIEEMKGKASYDRGMIKDYMIESLLSDFLDYTRSVTMDFDLMEKNYKKALAWCSLSVKQKVVNWINEEKPYKDSGRIRRGVSIESIIRLSNASWQYDWFDVDENMQGEVIGKVRYRGVFTIILEAPEDKYKYNNPLGVFIVDYNITRINEVMR